MELANLTARVLITGASGFIGGAIARRMKSAGWDVVEVGRRQLDRDTYVAHDLATALPRSLDGTYHAVVHAAARSSPWGRRAEFERDNIVATRNTIEFCERNGRPRLIYISSSSVFYRPEHQRGITESTPMPAQAVNVYAETKQRGESLVRAYRGPSVTLRPRAVYGPGDTILLPRIVAAARQRRLPLLVSPDGPVVGDLIYIENLVDHIQQAIASNQIVGDYNLTDNHPVPIFDFISQVLQRLDVPLPHRRVSVRTAMIGATLLETFHRVCLPRREPAITRFGVHVFAYSKTFNVQKMLCTFGPPRIPIAESVEHSIAWIQQQEQG